MTHHPARGEGGIGSPTADRPGGGGAADPTRWVDRHADALYRYALLQVREPGAAEECVQETLVAALEARRSFRSESSERTWLVGILRHKICDRFRRRRRETPVEPGVETLAAMFDAGGKWARQPLRWQGTPESLLQREEFLDVLQECLSRMPPRMGDAFILREVQGLSSEAICQVLDMTPTNLWTVLHRGRALLRECLERKWFASGSE